MIIVRALYGELPESIDSSRPLAEQPFGEVIDVTKPVQYLVEDSRIVVPGGDSKVLLKGFYDPVNGYPKVLAIRYLFQNRLHQLVINDFEAIRMPMKRTWNNCFETENVCVDVVVTCVISILLHNIRHFETFRTFDAGYF